MLANMARRSTNRVLLPGRSSQCNMIRTMQKFANMQMQKHLQMQAMGQPHARVDSLFPSDSNLQTDWARAPKACLGCLPCLPQQPSSCLGCLPAPVSQGLHGCQALLGSQGLFGSQGLLVPQNAVANHVVAIQKVLAQQQLTNTMRTVVMRLLLGCPLQKTPKRGTSPKARHLRRQC